MKKTLFFVVLAIGLVSCLKSQRTVRGAPVVLISIDTLRADHLPAYGYRNVETPAIDALRKDSILYRNAVSHVPLTLPSHTTLMTGLLPPQDGVRDNTGYVLSETHPTLASELKKRGYATGAAVSSIVLIKATGISRGFDFYDDDIDSGGQTLSIGEIQRSGFETEKIAEEWITTHATGSLFFFLHLYEPHTPYEPVEPYRSRYKNSPYDGEIATADAIVGRFVDFLKGRGLYKKSLVILLSDHGEGLGQHGEDEHGAMLYRETLHVPLLVKLPAPRDAGTAVDRPAGHVDVLPTVLELVGAAVPPGLAGRRLLASGGNHDPSRRIYSETLYPRYHYGWSDLASLTDDRWEYIQAPREELYDWVADPAEEKNLVPSLPPAFRSMRNALAAMDRPRQAPGASDPEQVKKLAALGYLGSARPSESATNLPDPKDHISELHDFKIVMKFYAENDYAAAIAAVRALLKKNPLMSDAWGALANCYHKLGLNREALEALRQQDRLEPGSPITLASFATEYLEMNDLKNARLYAERAIAVNGPPEAHDVLAAVFLQEKNYDAAEREALATKGGYRQRRKPLIVLAQIARARGDLPEALRRLDDIRAESSQKGQTEMSNVNYLRGDILGRLGRNAEAEAAFREEIKDFPGNAQAWTALAVLYASEGRSEDARATLLSMVKASPTPRSYQAAAEAFQVLGDAEEARHFRGIADRQRQRSLSAAPAGS